MLKPKIINNYIEAPSLLHVGSEVKMSGTTNQFVYNFDPAVAENCCAVALLATKIPLVQYNITALNNSFSIYTAPMGSSPPLALTIPIGSYDINSLTVALQTAINAAFGTTLNTSAVTYNPTTFKITFTNSQASTQLFFTGAIATILGFTPAVYGPSAIITSTGVVDLSQPDYLYIRILGINSMSRGLYSNQDTSVTFMVPTAGNPGTVLNYTSNTGFNQIIKNDSPIRNVTIELRTPGGKLYDLQGLNWSMILGLYYS